VIFNFRYLMGQLRIFEEDQLQVVSNISPYILATPNIFVETEPKPISTLPPMIMGSMPRDGGYLLLSPGDARELSSSHTKVQSLIRPYIGTDELVKGNQRRCLWIEDSDLDIAMSVPEICARLQKVSEMRTASPLDSTKEFANRPHRFVYLAGQAKYHTVGVGGASSETREYLPVALFDHQSVLSNLAFALYDAPLWNMALIASRLHLVWIATICGKLETRYRYSNTLGWNTFPVPTLTDQNKTDLTRCAEEILLAREHYFPATIAHMYDPTRMDSEFPLVREAHNQNDEVIVHEVLPNGKSNLHRSPLQKRHRTPRKTL
jgi:hypothetical protein